MKRTLEYLAGIFLLFMFLTTFFQVIARTFQISAVWSEELARISYVWMVFLGVPVLIRENGLIRVTVLADRVGPRIGKTLRVVTDLLTLPFLAVITWGAWMNTRLNWNTFAPTADWLRMGYVYLVIVVAGVAMFWYQAANIVDLARSALRGSGRGPEGWQ